MEEHVKCEYCKKQVKNNKNSRTGHLRSCRSWRQVKKEISDKITYEFLHEEYEVKEKSSTMIAQDLGLKKITIVNDKLKEFGIRKRTFAETRFTKSFIEQSKATSLKRYGSEYHTSKGTVVRDKIENSIKKLGVDNVFQLESVKTKCKSTKQERYGNEFYNNPDKVKETCMERFGYPNPWNSSDIQNKCVTTRYSKPQVYSKSSKKADNLFNEIHVKLENTDNIFYSAKNKEFAVRDKKYYFYDFVDTTRKKCIEFNGNYWHANPLFYSPTEFNKKANLTSSEIWERDIEKLGKLQKLGYEIKVIWEHDFDTDPESTINECIDFMTT